jgi:hypothetical protein
MPYGRVQGARSPQLAATGERLRGAAPAAGAAINRKRDGAYVVDRDGRVLRDTGDGRLEVRGERNWTERPAAERPVQRPAAERPAAERPAATRPKPTTTPTREPIKRSQPQQTQQMRSRGETRVQQRASPPPRPASRPAGGGGGGRRR